MKTSESTPTSPINITTSISDEKDSDTSSSSPKPIISFSIDSLLSDRRPVRSRPGSALSSPAPSCSSSEDPSEAEKAYTFPYPNLMYSADAMMGHNGKSSIGIGSMPMVRTMLTPTSSHPTWHQPAFTPSMTHSENYGKCSFEIIFMVNANTLNIVHIHPY